MTGELLSHQQAGSKEALETGVTSSGLQQCTGSYRSAASALAATALVASLCALWRHGLALNPKC
jgi:hypothetical protein